MKALAKEPSERYPSADSLAADIQRCLRNEPVDAYRPSRWYRLRKTWQRNRVAISVAIAINVFIIGFAVFSAYQNWRIRTEQARADLERNRFVSTIDRADELLAELTEISDRLGAIDQADSVNGELQTALLNYLDGLIDDVGDVSPETEMDWIARAAEAYFHVGRIRNDRGESDQAIQAYRDSIEYARLVRDAKPEEDRWLRLEALSANNLGIVYSEIGETRQSLDSFDHGLELREQLFEANPVDGRREDLAVSYANVGIREISIGQREKGIDHLLRAKEMFETLVDGLSPRESPVHFGFFASCLHNLALHHPNADQRVSFHESTRAIRLELATEYPDNSEYTVAYGQSRLRDLDAARAAANVNEARTIVLELDPMMRSLFERFPDRIDVAQMFVDVRLNFSSLLHENLEHDRSLNASLSAQSVLDRQLLPANPDSTRYLFAAAQVSSLIAKSNAALGNADEALLAGLATVEAYKRLADVDSTNAAWRMHLIDELQHLGFRYLDLEQLTDAMDSFRQSKDLVVEAIGTAEPVPAELAALLAARNSQIATVMLELDLPEEAEALMRQSVSQYIKLVGEYPKRTDDFQNLAYALFELAKLEHQQLRLDDAIATIDEAITHLTVAIPNARDKFRAFALATDLVEMQVAIHVQSGNVDQAVNTLRSAINVWSDLPDWTFFVGRELAGLCDNENLSDRDRVMTESLDLLIRSIDNGFTQWNVLADPKFDSIRNEPRFPSVPSTLDND